MIAHRTRHTITPSQSGKFPDGAAAYLLVETSITIVKNDIDRAKERAELLQRDIGPVTHAVVIGEAIADDAATQAKDRAVKFTTFMPSQTLVSSISILRCATDSS